MLEKLFASFGAAFAKGIADRVGEALIKELTAKGVIDAHQEEKAALLREVKDAKSQEERDAILRKLYDLLPTSRMR